MGLFNIFHRAKKPDVLHLVFGRIVYQGDETWELGKALFPPVGHEVKVIIDAGINGPGEEHMVFWRELIERWPELKKALRASAQASTRGLDQCAGRSIRSCGEEPKVGLTRPPCTSAN